VEGPLTDLCQLAGALVAIGTATVVWGEKNVPPPGELGPGAGIIHITAHGILDLTSGGEARLSSRAHELFKDGSPVVNTNVVTLTPL
jgi:hypothetical protein